MVPLPTPVHDGTRIALFWVFALCWLIHTGELGVVLLSPKSLLGYHIACLPLALGYYLILACSFSKWAAGLIVYHTVCVVGELTPYAVAAEQLLIGGACLIAIQLLPQTKLHRLILSLFYLASFQYYLLLQPQPISPTFLHLGLLWILDVGLCVVYGSASFSIHVTVTLRE